jgi:hypothetical protein
MPTQKKKKKSPFESVSFSSLTQSHTHNAHSHTKFALPITQIILTRTQFSIFHTHILTYI